jgi:acyl-CoA reductase-like NAD-dependent aldehyde dehydrogenase
VDEWSAAEREQFVDLLRRFTSNLESRRDEVARAMTQSHGQTTERLRGTRAEFRSDTTAVNQPTHLQHHEHVHLHASSERSN